jgi:hypothetical protein
VVFHFIPLYPSCCLLHFECFRSYSSLKYNSFSSWWFISRLCSLGMAFSNWISRGVVLIFHFFCLIEKFSGLISLLMDEQLSLVIWHLIQLVFSPLERPFFWGSRNWRNWLVSAFWTYLRCWLFSYIVWWSFSGGKLLFLILKRYLILWKVFILFQLGVRCWFVSCMSI